MAAHSGGSGRVATQQLLANHAEAGNSSHQACSTPPQLRRIRSPAPSLEVCVKSCGLWSFGSIEMLDFSGFTSEPPNSAVSTGLAALVAELHGLRPFPQTAQRLISTVCDPNHRAAEVISIIETDPELTAKVLRLVNSGAFGVRHVCESIERGVVLLGTRQVAELAAARLALEQFEATGRLGMMVASHSLSVAALSRRLARGRAVLSGVDVFTPGILHDVGKLLLLQVDQGEYSALLGEASPQAETSQEQERVLFGFDHAMLADYVMERWNLPEFLRTVVSLHHDQDASFGHGAQVVEAVAVLRLADYLDYALGVDPAGDCAAEMAALDAAELLELSEEALRALWPELLDLRQRLG